MSFGHLGASFGRLGASAHGGGGGALPFLRGTNHSGQESGGSVFAFPSDQGLQYFIDKGVDVFRLPFSMERMCPTPGGNLDATYSGFMQHVVDYITSRGCRVILDPHNSMRFDVGATITDTSITGGTTAIIGQDAGYTAAQFADFHVKMFQKFSGSKIIRGMMNEPWSVDAATYIATCNTVLTALRGAGCKDLILINGLEFGSYQWGVGSNNRTYMPQIVDSLNNWAVDLHHYLDASGPGTSTTVDAAYLTTLTALTPYFLSAGFKVFVGETGAGADNISLSALANVIAHIETNQNVYVGWTYWTAVQFQDTYIYQLLPTELTNGGVAGPYTDRAEMGVLGDYFSAAAVAPSYLSDVSLSGAANVGVTPTVQLGTPVGFPAPVETYQWYRDGVAVSGATDLNRPFASADIGHTMTLETTATNTEGSATSTSNGIGPVAAGTPTLDPAETASGITLSNGNLTAASAGNQTNPWPVSRCTVGATTGKKYFSATNTTTGASAQIGFVNDNYAVGTSTAHVGDDAKGIGWNQNGGLGMAGSFPGSVAAWTAGGTCDLAIDIDNKLAWFRVNGGNWNNSGTANPATGTGGFSFTSPAGTKWYPAIVCFSCGFTVNFGGSTYTNAAPSGFSSFT